MESARTAMPIHSDLEKTLIEKIRALPADKVAEVEEFIDFIAQRNEERRLVRASGQLAEEAFRTVWDNPDDAEYDRL